MLPVRQGQPPEFASPEPSKTIFHVSAAKLLRRRTHQPLILRLAGAESNHALPIAVRTDGTATQHQRTTRNTLPSSDTACTVCISMRVTRFCHLNNPTCLERSLFSPISSRFDGCRILRAKISALDQHIWSVTGQILCTHHGHTIPI